MKKVLFSFFITVSFCFAEITPKEKLELMKNYLLMGVEREGVLVCSDILSLDSFSSVKEDAEFTIAEYYFAKGLLEVKPVETINKAYTFYLKLLNDYPSTTYLATVKQRIYFLESNYNTYLLFRNLANYVENQKIIVNKKLELVDVLVDKHEENPYLFMNKADEIDTRKTIEKYFDDIIVNEEIYALYAYYYKLLAALSPGKVPTVVGYEMNDIFKSRLGDEIQTASFSKSQMISEVIEILHKMEGLSANHPLTIQAYLVAVSYLINCRALSYDSNEVKELLEYVLKNEKDKLSLRFLLTKEFMLNVKF